jgi:hypothetical protein
VTRVARPFNALRQLHHGLALHCRHWSVGDDVRRRNEINGHAADASLRQEETQEEKTP